MFNGGGYCNAETKGYQCKRQSEKLIARVR
jgi:hypothetical protein